MKNAVLLLLLLALTIHSASAQEKTTKPFQRKGSFFFYWGYNRSMFAKSDIHFRGTNYDFTIYDVKASDRPSNVDAVYVDPGRFSIPQYNYRLGFYITERLAITAGMDHIKYVMEQDQTVNISGVIKHEASSEYEGVYLNQPIKLTRDFLMFEHTNGFNCASLDVEYLHPVTTFMDKKLSLHWNVGVGVAGVIAKTDVRVMGDGLDNRFHLSGYALTAKTGPRLEYKNRVFLSAELKGGYSSLPSVLIKNSAPERANHNVQYLEYYVVAGYNFRLKFLDKKEDKN